MSMQQAASHGGDNMNELQMLQVWKLERFTVDVCGC